MRSVTDGWGLSRKSTTGTFTIGELTDSSKRRKDSKDVRLSLPHLGPTLNFTVVALGATPTELLGMDKEERFEAITTFKLLH
jgi:hypothetical protein